MSKFTLNGGFTPIPEGYHVFKVESVNYKAQFGKLEINLVTANGKKHTERFSLHKANGEINEGAMNAFSYFAKTCLNDFNVEEIDEQDLVGHYIRCEVTHTVLENKNKPGKMVTFVNLGEKEPADGFDETPAPAKKTEAPAPSPAPASSFDLGSLLG